MNSVIKMIENGTLCLIRVFYTIITATKELKKRKRSKTKSLNKSGVLDCTTKFSKEVLDEFRNNVGKFHAETGGMLASTKDKSMIDICYFDVHSKNTSGTFYYDVETMSEIFRKWKKHGYITNGIYHSHPIGTIHPSFHDISSALLHINFFHLDYFYLPIFQNDIEGFYTMYFYVAHKMKDNLVVNLNYVLKATEDGYEYMKFDMWKQTYSIKQLESYRKSIDEKDAIKEKISNTKKAEFEEKKIVNDVSNTMNKSLEMRGGVTLTIGLNSDQEKKEYFSKVQSLYPKKVLDKVIVFVGTGGARSAIENFARSGFRNFILMDADVVSPTNIATQGVFVSEMGKKKVYAVRDRILDINPYANVVCVDRFLDDDMSDEEFKSYLELFKNKKSTDYLIFGCTDDFTAQKRSSILALKYSIPYLAAMMYKGGVAAELIFVYPGVTQSCPRCLLRSRFEKYENGFVNDVDSSECTIFATERMNALKGYIALMMLMYHEDPSSSFNTMLDEVKDRNFVWIRLNPQLKENIGIGLFDKVFKGAERYTYMDETIWVPQTPDNPKHGSETCKLCGGIENLTNLYMKWPDSRKV